MAKMLVAYVCGRHHSVSMKIFPTDVHIEDLFVSCSHRTADDRNEDLQTKHEL